MITWNELPVEIQEKMLEHQVAQGNKKDPKVLIKSIMTDASGGGFYWWCTDEGYDFWAEIITNENISHFYTLYPKQNYPKVMMVSMYPITKTNPGKPRVVFMEKCGKYIAWYGAKTIEEAETALGTTSWRYAKDIEPENPKKQELLAKANELIKKAEELKEMANKL